MKVSIYLVLALGVILYFIVPLIIWLFYKDKKYSKTIVVTLLVLYIIVLLIGVLGKIEIGKVVEVSLDFGGSWCSKKIKWSLFNLNKTDVLINIFMLIPLGLVYKYFSKNKFRKNILMLLLIGLCVGVLIETLQFILPVPRSVQLSDVILNSISVFIGGMIGCFYDFLSKRLRKN